MATGIGTDIIEVKRIRDNIERHGARFLSKVFTQAEQEYCLKHKESSRHFAGRFAAKEAIVKALGTGFSRGISWLDIEITNDILGRPRVILSQWLSEEFNEPHIIISISHCHEYATATALCN